MSELPLVEQLKKHVEENNILFCMPGHKAGIGFLDTEEGKWIYDHFLQCDITEIEGLDNLHHPEGVIADAMKLLAKHYKSYRSYFLVNGSTSGNLAMLFAAFEEGDKIIVERNCHRSISNGIALRKLQPVYISNKINKRYDAPLSIDMEHFFFVLEANKDAKGILLTYPNYYGICVDLKAIVKRASEYNMKVLVDAAHGAHFGVVDNLPQNPIELGAHMAVMSAHKTLPSLTQTAYLHINNAVDVEKIEFYVSAFMSTSPSYLLLAAMDYARFYLDTRGKVEYEKLIQKAERYRKKINALPGFHILQKEDDICIFNIDLSRYVINLERGYSGEKLLQYLKRLGIQCEMSDGRNVILILSPFFSEEVFKQLYDALEQCDLSELRESYIDIVECNIPAQRLFPFEVVTKNKEWIPFTEALGYICALSVVPYPPGVPILMMGEEVNEDAIRVIEYYMRNKGTILGIENHKISVIIKEKTV